MVTDGPFAETKEQLGGFYLIECESTSTRPSRSAAKLPTAAARLDRGAADLIER